MRHRKRIRIEIALQVFSSLDNLRGCQLGHRRDRCPVERTRGVGAERYSKTHVVCLVTWHVLLHHALSRCHSAHLARAEGDGIRPL